MGSSPEICMVDFSAAARHIGSSYSLQTSFQKNMSFLSNIMKNIQRKSAGYIPAEYEANEPSPG